MNSKPQLTVYAYETPTPAQQAALLYWQRQQAKEKAAERRGP